MKVLAYSYREDEDRFFAEFAELYGIELTTCRDGVSLENADLAKGFDCISIITTKVEAPLVDKLADNGVKLISTRTIGYDHVDVARCKERGVRVSNVSYAPESVADYAIMLMLMASRKMKHIMERFAVQDFTLAKVQGRVLANMTVGIVGTGRIGQTVIRHLSGFGCKILCCDIFENEECKKYATYTDLDTLISECDLISLHAPLNDETYHIVSKKNIDRMKEGVIIVNTARGALIDTMDLAAGIESGRVGAAALDVIEDESLLYYTDRKYESLDNRGLAILRSYPNVILTPHTAFYTDQAVSDMVKYSLMSCMYYYQGKNIPWEK